MNIPVGTIGYPGVSQTRPIASLGTIEPPRTIGEAILRHAQQNPDNPAFVSSKFAPLTYSELKSQLDITCSQLRQAGLDRNARIGVLLPNSPEAVLAIVALACCAVAVPIDPRLTTAELDRRLSVLRLDAVLLPLGSTSKEQQFFEDRNLLVLEAIPVGNGKIGLTLETPTSSAIASSEPPEPNAPAFILQTSGTTAQPKLIPFSHSNMLAAASRLQTWFKLRPRDRCLNASPPYYSHGLKVTVFTPLLTGGSIAFPTAPHAVDLAEWFEGLRPTWYSAGPTMHRAVLDKAEQWEDAAVTHTLRFIVSGGAPLPTEVQRGLQSRLGVPVLEHYGSSEAAQIAANLPPPGSCKPGTCGMPWPGTLIIVGEDGQSLRSGQEGEVWVRGPTVMSGYLDDTELNRWSFVDGWFRTGDIGSLDEDGFLTLHGRLSEFINRGGEKIAPAEVDDALLRHPAVAEAAAFATPHPRLGEDVAAAVVLRPGATATPVELRRFLQESLTSYKIPHRILILDQLPKGLTGKIQRRLLSETWRAETTATVASPMRVTPVSAADLERQLLKLWQRLLRSSAIGLDDDFFDCGGDSLLATEMLLEAEQLVGHPISPAGLLEAATVRRLAAKFSDPIRSGLTPLSHLHAEGSHTPLILFHGDLERGGLYVHQMLKLLGADQPVITIAPPGACGEPIPPTIEQIAADCLPLILEQRLDGPFLLAGYCNGAMVAFEVAHRLIRSGHQVGLLALIDPPTVSVRPTTRLLLKILMRTVAPRRLAWIYSHLTMLERALKLPLSTFLAKARRHVADADFVFPLQSWLEAYNVAMARYRPVRLEVPTVFYAAAHDGSAWRRISSDLEVVEISGGHTGVLTTHVHVLVEHLQQRLVQARQHNQGSSDPDQPPSKTSGRSMTQPEAVRVE